MIAVRVRIWMSSLVPRFFQYSTSMIIYINNTLFQSIGSIHRFHLWIFDDIVLSHVDLQRMSRRHLPVRRLPFANLAATAFATAACTTTLTVTVLMTHAFEALGSQALLIHLDYELRSIFLLIVYWNKITIRLCVYLLLLLCSEICTRHVIESTRHDILGRCICHWVSSCRTSTNFSFAFIFVIAV